MVTTGNLRQDDYSVRPVVYGIGLYFLLSGADNFQIGSIGSVLKLVALIPLALALPDIRKWRIRFSTVLAVQLLFWFLTVVSILYSVNPDRTFSSVKALTLNLALVFCLGIMQRYNERELRFMEHSLLAGGWMTVAMMLVFSDFSAGGRLTLVLGGDTQDQNYINGFFLYAFSWHCSQVLLKKKHIHIIPTAVMLVIVLMTGSRGALLAFMLVMFVHTCILFAGSRHKVRNILLVLLLMALFLAVFDVVLAQMPEEMARRYSWDYIAEKGTTGRTRIWRFLLDHYSDDSIPRMLFGHGYGTTPLINTLNAKVAHNLYLDNLMTLGIAGLMLQLAVQGSVAWILLRRRQYPLFGAYLGMMGMCMSLSLVAYKPIWNIMLMALAIDACHTSATYSANEINGRFQYESDE